MAKVAPPPPAICLSTDRDAYCWDVAPRPVKYRTSYQPYAVIDNDLYPLTPSRLHRPTKTLPVIARTMAGAGAPTPNEVKDFMYRRVDDVHVTWHPEGAPQNKQDIQSASATLRQADQYTIPFERMFLLQGYQTYLATHGHLLAVSDPFLKTLSLTSTYASDWERKGALDLGNGDTHALLSLEALLQEWEIDFRTRVPEADLRVQEAQFARWQLVTPSIVDRDPNLSRYWKKDRLELQFDRTLAKNGDNNSSRAHIHVEGQEWRYVTLDPPLLDYLDAHSDTQHDALTQTLYHETAHAWWQDTFTGLLSELALKTRIEKEGKILLGSFFSRHVGPETELVARTVGLQIALRQAKEALASSDRVRLRILMQDIQNNLDHLTNYASQYHGNTPSEVRQAARERVAEAIGHIPFISDPEEKERIAATLDLLFKPTAANTPRWATPVADSGPTISLDPMSASDPAAAILAALTSAVSQDEKGTLYEEISALQTQAEPLLSQYYKATDIGMDVNALFGSACGLLYFASPFLKLNKRAYVGIAVADMVMRPIVAGLATFLYNWKTDQDLSPLEAMSVAFMGAVGNHVIPLLGLGLSKIPAPVRAAPGRLFSAMADGVHRKVISHLPAFIRALPGQLVRETPGLGRYLAGRAAIKAQNLPPTGIGKLKHGAVKTLISGLTSYTASEMTRLTLDGHRYQNAGEFYNGIYPGNAWID